MLALLAPLLNAVGASSLQVFTDATFEHDTQASTGATTGTWLVAFGEAGCARCDQIYEEIEEQSEGLREAYILSARVDKANGAKLWKRFAIKETPTVLLFKQGKMYRHDVQKGNILQFATEAGDGGVKVPPEPSFLDELVANAKRILGLKDEL
eukprot:TRINITY_DN43691_c0_g1_i1.p1 TRINITY_DN43691_c0_g1~~TRINITY_DN43691_c0_g1_i1.p1  ORF type:complete len:178 (+),score=42.96 TRINITY_DN43691_c0_g1_i1:76-534(+)